MAMINCPECKKEISDTVDNCIHCGYSLAASKAPSKTSKPHKNSETQIHKAVDAIFALLYIYLFYMMFFNDSAPTETGGAFWFGMFIGFVLIYFVQKMAKAILGTIGRSFDDAFNKKNT